MTQARSWLTREPEIDDPRVTSVTGSRQLTVPDEPSMASVWEMAVTPKHNTRGTEQKHDGWNQSTQKVRLLDP